MTSPTPATRSRVPLASALVLLCVVAIGVFVGEKTHAQQRSSDCVTAVGDITGDGIPDYAVTAGPGARTTSSLVVSLIAGSANGTAADQVSKQRPIAVLRGIEAVPFECSPSGFRPVKVTKALGEVAAHVGQRLRQFVASPIAEPMSYVMTDLAELAPASLPAASAINAAGHVVGRAMTVDGFEHAFLYDGSAIHSLGTLGGHFSDAKGINASDSIVGYSLTGDVDEFGFVNSAFVSDGQSMQPLGGPWSAAYAINDERQVAGTMRPDPAVDASHAFLFENGQAIDLGTLPPLDDSVYATGLAINRTGQIVGESNTYVAGVSNPDVLHHSVRGFLYDNGLMHDLGSFGPLCGIVNDNQEVCFERSTASDINNKSEIAGFSSGPAGFAHAFVRIDGEMQDLGTLGGSQSWAFAVNDSRQIVGSSLTADETYRPFLYDQGTMYDLHDLIVNNSDDISGMFAAYDINNFGQIVGNHHLLNPVYRSVAPGRSLSFTTTLRESLSFAYWVSRHQTSECHVKATRLVLTVAIAAQRQALASVIPLPVGCGQSEDWESLVTPIPETLQGETGRIHIRIRELGSNTQPTVYLRHFQMD